MKLLKDWTLEEAHNYCIGYRFSHENNCVGCKLFKQCRHSFGSFDFIPPTQEETIVWHKYPEDKPTTLGLKLVTFRDTPNIVDAFSFARPNGYTTITAWADFPNVPKWEGD